MPRTKTTSVRKSEDKESFQAIFKEQCTKAKCSIIPVVKVIQSNIKQHSENWKIYPINVTPADSMVDIYIQNDNFEKDGFISKFIIKNSAVESKMLIALKETLQVFSTLSFLRLSYCKLTFVDIDLLGDILKELPSIMELCIDGNPNSHQNFFVLFQNNKLQYVSMQRCQINKRGIKLIARALNGADNQTITTLNLTGNFIGDCGIKHITKSLRVNRSLISLQLADNLITDYGIFTLMDVFKKFELNEDEIIKRREINFKYEFDKIPLIKQFKYDMQNPESRAFNVTSAKIKKKKNSLKEKRSVGSNLSSKRDGKTKKNNERFEQYLEIYLPKSTNPFVRESAPENGSIFCIGNLKLAHLNLAYNKITSEGLNFILQTMRYQQSAVNFNENNTGLISIVLNGNDVDCPEFEELKTLLQEQILSSVYKDHRPKSSLKQSSSKYTSTSH